MLEIDAVIYELFRRKPKISGARKCLPYCFGFSAYRFPSSFCCCCYGTDRGGRDAAKRGDRPWLIGPNRTAGERIASAQSGVSWAAVIAGGVTASAVAIILLLFGSGLGLASISPWAGRGVSAASFTVFAAIWLIIVQWVASGLGGYMAGRLRTKWVAVHTDEVLFRDTAHGFLSWALGVLVTAMVLAAGLRLRRQHWHAIWPRRRPPTPTSPTAITLICCSGRTPTRLYPPAAARSPPLPRSPPRACPSSRINRCAPKPRTFWRKRMPMAACRRPTASIWRNWWRNEPGCRRQMPKSGSRMC